MAAHTSYRLPIALGALLSLAGCEAEGDNGELLERHAALRPLGQSVFDSSELPQLTHALSVIAGGFFLPDSGIVLVETTEVYFVDMASGETRVFGREGGGPLEFRRIQRALRSPQGIALRDRYRLRVVFLDNSGEYVGDMRYNTVPFKGGVMDALPVAVHPDGRIVFRDREGKDFGSYRGRTWDAIEYLAVDSEGEVEVVAQAKGSEYYYEAKSSGRVFFGHSTLMAASSDRVAVAETDQEGHPGVRMGWRRSRPHTHAAGRSTDRRPSACGTRVQGW